MHKTESSNRVAIQKSGDTLRIEVQGRNHWGLFIPFAVILGLLTLAAIIISLATPVVLVASIVESLTGQSGSLAWLPFWLLLPAVLVTLAATIIALCLLWPKVLGLVPGREILVLDAGGLTIQRTSPFPARRIIPAARILAIGPSGILRRGRLSGSSLLTGIFHRGLWVWQTGKWDILPLMIGSGLEPQDADLVLAAIRKRHPHFE